MTECSVNDNLRTGKDLEGDKCGPIDVFICLKGLTEPTKHLGTAGVLIRLRKGNPPPPIHVYSTKAALNFSMTLSTLFVQLMHTILIKLLKSFKIIIVAPTCFGLHKPKHVGATIIILNDFNNFPIL